MNDMQDYVIEDRDDLDEERNRMNNVSGQEDDFNKAVNNIKKNQQ